MYIVCSTDYNGVKELLDIVLIEYKAQADACASLSQHKPF